MPTRIVGLFCFVIDLKEEAVQKIFFRIFAVQIVDRDTTLQCICVTPSHYFNYPPGCLKPHTIVPTPILLLRNGWLHPATAYITEYWPTLSIVASSTS